MQVLETKIWTGGREMIVFVLSEYAMTIRWLNFLPPSSSISSKSDLSYYLNLGIATVKRMSDPT